MIKVSIVLPSFNVRQYIKDCLESVIGQTLQEIEIICVDAGSTDGTLEIIKEYTKKDSRIKLIVSKEKSYGYQMNLGIDSASGEYIGIVETDDFILPDMYESLYIVAKTNKLDFVKSDFYRFTGKNGHIDREYNKLYHDSSYYNRVIDILDEQITFDFIMNTWSGIYKRSFLDRYNIRHNETPGASFQDNGFWFQTFMHAKRAFFLDRAFYMNRRDNENSSVHNKEKVYCICDEYAFLLHILKENDTLLDNYGKTFAYACFRAYRANLYRIDYMYKKEFVFRWSKDFKNFNELGMLEEKRFLYSDWEILNRIMNDPEGYYKESIVREEIFFDEVKKNKNIIIYGAGMIGKKVFNMLMNCIPPVNVVCFAVTKKECNYSSYQNVPIKEITDLIEYRDCGCIVIGTTVLYQKEIKDNLTDLGFKNIICAPFN